MKVLQVDSIVESCALASRAARDANHLASNGVAVSQVEVSQTESCGVGPTGGAPARAILTWQRTAAADDQRNSRQARSHAPEDARPGQKGVHNVAAKLLQMDSSPH